MANTLSSKKRIRQNLKRRDLNKSVRSYTRNRIKLALDMLETGDQDKAGTAVKDAVGALDRAVSKGVLHRNNASRRKSRLMRRLSKLNRAD